MNIDANKKETIRLILIIFPLKFVNCLITSSVCVQLMSLGDKGKMISKIFKTKEKRLQMEKEITVQLNFFFCELK